MKYTVTLELDFLDDSDATGYPAGWLEGALRHLFETYNDLGDLVAVRYQFEGMDRQLEVRP